jgi:hypothetical protein
MEILITNSDSRPKNVKFMNENEGFNCNFCGTSSDCFVTKNQDQRIPYAKICTNCVRIMNNYLKES